MVRTEPLARNGLLLFWGQWPSNWCPSPFTIDGVTYSCVEQYMMAEKADLFGDWGTKHRIMATTDPAEQKRLGKSVTPYIEAEWAAIRYDVVLKATIEKYRQNPELKAKLLASVGRFVEAAPDDRVWGIGLRATDPRAHDPKQWRGTNLLGKALDEARDVIRAETTK
jgi:ribA/ribD-fused uncharacterized protein